MKELIKDVEQWGRDKGILDKATVATQGAKVFEEGNEVIEAIKEYINDATSQNLDNVKLELGDYAVTLILANKLNEICCDMMKVDHKECLQMAYKKISKRTGKMINGTFYKSEDIDKDGKPKR